MCDRTFAQQLSFMASQGIDRYLERYAEPIITERQEDLRLGLSQTYTFVLVIPLYDEALNCLDTVLPEGMCDTLIILVVNAAADADPAAILRTQTFLAQFHPNLQQPFTIVHRPLGNTLLLIDCCTSQRQLPPKQGVGLARKIGGDMALTCIALDIVEIPWIHCSDGDVVLPNGYFDPAKPQPDVAAAIYPFCHRPVHNNILQYEISLRYYVTALAKATSSYAFQTIGSLLKINATHYAMVRGFPKRQAAEDFYMLNKLAKTGKVIRLKQPEVTLSSRMSQRVPFGTGAAMTRLSSEETVLLYHPQIFRELRSWLELSPTLWTELRPGGGNPFVTKPRFHSWWQQQRLSDSLLQTLLYLKVDQALGQAFRQCQDFCHFQFFLEVWFDAFRTLKFIHYQRDQYWSSLAIKDAMAIYGCLKIQNQAQPIRQLCIASQQAHFYSSQDFLDILQQLQCEEFQLSSEVGPTVSFGR